MKTIVVTLRLTAEEKKKLDVLARKSNKSISNCARDLMFNNQKVIADINQALVQVQEQIRMNADALEDLKRNNKQLLRHEFLVSESIFATRWASNKLLNHAVKALEGRVPSDYQFPSNAERESFIRSEMEKLRNDIKEIL
jgi:hypothetical protein